jgi:hypothetical protein
MPNNTRAPPNALHDSSIGAERQGAPWSVYLEETALKDQRLPKLATWPGDGIIAKLDSHFKSALGRTIRAAIRGAQLERAIRPLVAQASAWCAGINRHRVADERAVQERNSEPSWPRVMRGQP